MKRNGKPWHWRWLVISSDRAPMPPHKEIVYGCFTRRGAEQRYRSLTLAHAGHPMAHKPDIYITRN